MLRSFIINAMLVASIFIVYQAVLFCFWWFVPFDQANTYTAMSMWAMLAVFWITSMIIRGGSDGD